MNDANNQERIYELDRLNWKLREKDYFNKIEINILRDALREVSSLFERDIRVLSVLKNYTQKINSLHEEREKSLHDTTLDIKEAI